MSHHPVETNVSADRPVRGCGYHARGSNDVTSGGSTSAALSGNV